LKLSARRRPIKNQKKKKPPLLISRPDNLNKSQHQIIPSIWGFFTLLAGGIENAAFENQSEPNKLLLLLLLSLSLSQTFSLLR
jgi:hypothetical protein